MQKFNVILKNDKIKAYRFITLLIVTLHLVFFIFLLFNNTLWKNAVIGFGVIILYTILKIIIAKVNNKKFYYDYTVFILFAILLAVTFFSKAFWIIIFESILIMLAIFSFQQIAFEFDSSGIKQKNFPWKKYKWQQLDNVILKDNILTLDFKNNRIIQSEITSANAPEEMEFNMFVREQLVYKR